MMSLSQLDGPRTAFAVLCLIGMLAIAGGAFLEMRRARRGESLVTLHQFRLRIFSAFVWLIILGSLCYAVLFLWPTRGDIVQKKRFVAMTGGAFVLIFIALGLLLYDVILLARRRRLHEAQFEQRVSALAQGEIERLQKQPRTDETSL